MKAHFKSSTGRLLIELQADNIKELFEQIAEVQEVLDADSSCGACASAEVRFRVRTVEKYKYYELHCQACNAVLAFGQNRDGAGLFPKRFTENREPLPNRGWTRYVAARKS